MGVQNARMPARGRSTCRVTHPSLTLGHLLCRSPLTHSYKDAYFGNIIDSLASWQLGSGSPKPFPARPTLWMVCYSRHVRGGMRQRRHLPAQKLGMPRPAWESVGTERDATQKLL